MTRYNICQMMTGWLDTMSQMMTLDDKIQYMVQMMTLDDKIQYMSQMMTLDD
jgi:hypothetical protein